MKPDSYIYRFFRTSLFTSPLIGILAISPIFINRGIPVTTFPQAVLIITGVTLIIWWLNILLLYANERLNSPRYLNPVRYLITYIIAILLTITAMKMLRLCFFGMTETPVFSSKLLPYAPTMLGLAINSVILIILDSVMHKSKQAQFEIEKAKLNLSHAEALNQQLKQQIHPHFLFNSLSTLKSLIHKSPEAAEDYLVKLSDFLRKSVSPGEDNLFKVDDELKLCIDYLEMQKIRYGVALQYHITVPEEIRNTGYIPAFSLQLLVENALKHNALTDEAPLKIDIDYNSSRLIVSNNLQRRKLSESNSGLGLINLSERYRILSDEEIIIYEDDESFSVSIKVLKNEDHNH